MRQLAAAAAIGALLVSLPAAAGGAGVTREAAPFTPQSQSPAPVPDVPRNLELAANTSTNNPPLPIGVENDVYCSGWLGDKNEAFPGGIVSAEVVESQSIYMEGDVVYLDFGANEGVVAGQEYWVVRPERIVHKWGSEFDEIGRVYLTPGRVRIICALETSSIAEITRSCDAVEVGDLVLPFEPIPIPLVRRTHRPTSCEPPNGKVTGRIVGVKDAGTPISSTSVVYIDLGASSGLRPGDFLTVYRNRTEAVGIRTVLGEIAILKTRENTAVAIVTAMSDTMWAGDEIEIK